MSLKAKIEAVIYASEEPVTLAQLTGLLAEEAQAELDAHASPQQSLALEDLSIPDQDALNAETLELTEDSDVLSEGSGELEGETPDSVAESIPQLEPQAVEPSSPPETESSADAAEESADAETEERAAVETKEPAPATHDKTVAAALKQKDRRLREYFRSLLDELIRDYATESRGLEIREVAGGFRLATKPEYHDAVRGFVKSLKPPLKLSLQALETLAVVAYKQPVTSPEVSEIRGVDSAGVLGSLMARKLVTTAGRKQVIGRPILYKTTKDFLMRFGLKDINELPSIEEFEKMAGELNAAVQEEIPMDEWSTNSADRERGDRNEDAGASESALDEINSAPEPTHINHDTPEDLMSDRSTHPEGHNREHADKHEVDPLAENAAACQSNLRAEDGDATETSENMADEVVIDGRISGPPPSYADDSPSAEEAREQQDEQEQE